MIALPFFSYLVVLNLLTTWFVCLVMWFSVTTHTQREFLFGALLRESRKLALSRMSSKLESNKMQASQKYTSKQDTEGEEYASSSHGDVSPMFIQETRAVKHNKTQKDHEFEEYTLSGENPLFQGKDESVRKSKNYSTLSSQ
jgi:hypothetical protein